MWTICIIISPLNDLYPLLLYLAAATHNLRWVDIYICTILWNSIGLAYNVFN